MKAHAVSADNQHLDDGWSSEPLERSPAPGIDDGWVLADEPLASPAVCVDAMLRRATIFATPGRVVIYPSSNLADSEAYRSQCSWIDDSGLGVGASLDADESEAGREARWHRLWSWALR